MKDFNYKQVYAIKEKNKQGTKMNWLTKRTLKGTKQFARVIYQTCYKSGTQAK